MDPWLQKRALNEVVVGVLTSRDHSTLPMFDKVTRGWGPFLDLVKLRELCGLPCETGPDPIEYVPPAVPLKGLAARYPERRFSLKYLTDFCRILHCSAAEVMDLFGQLRQSARVISRDWETYREIDNIVKAIIPDLALAPIPRVIPWLKPTQLRQHWHVDSATGGVIMAHLDYPTLPDSQWLYYKMHDWVHGLHLGLRPQLYHEGGLSSTITLEALAMYFEVRLQEYLNRGGDLGSLASARDGLIGEVAHGLFERALRLEMDMAVHGRGEDLDSWVVRAARVYGLSPNFVESCVRPVHGFPLYGACYILGAETLLRNRALVSEIIHGKSYVDLGDLCLDPLSRDPSTDIPAVVPIYGIALQQAGIEGIVVDVCVAGRPSEFKLDLSVELDARKRGAHMSRLQQVCQSAAAVEHPTLYDLGRSIVRDAAHSHPTARVKCRMSSSVFITTRSLVTGKVGQIDVPVSLIFIYDAYRDTLAYNKTMSFRIMSVCPCTQVYSNLLADRAGQGTGPAHTFSHMQPGTLTVEFSGDGAAFPDVAMIRAELSRALPLREPILKREDEHALVDNAFGLPMFCEDIVRLAVSSLQGLFEGVALVSVTARLDESIHPHQAVAYWTR